MTASAARPASRDVRDVLADADDVLTDWHGSPDAFTWSPTPDVRIRVAIEALPAFLDTVRDVFDQLTAVAADVARSLRGVADALAPLVRPVVPADADPVDPRAHALAYRAHRNTGPAVPADWRRR